MKVDEESSRDTEADEDEEEDSSDEEDEDCTKYINASHIGVSTKLRADFINCVSR